tara:strand:- start:1165 stop:1410 length:246 start_codon:yes stop_codon:yes gene_type:complete
MARKSTKPVKSVGFKLSSGDDIREGTDNKFYARFRTESDIAGYIDSDYIRQFPNLDADTFGGDAPENIRINMYDSLGTDLR